MQKEVYITRMSIPVLVIIYGNNKMPNDGTIVKYKFWHIREIE